MFGFIQAWNEFTLALVVMTRPDQHTLPLWLSAFTDVNRGTDWGAIMAGSTLIAIPVIVFFLFVQGRMAVRAGRRGGEGMSWTSTGSRSRVQLPSFPGPTLPPTGAGLLEEGLGGICLFGSNTARAARSPALTGAIQRPPPARGRRSTRRAATSPGCTRRTAAPCSARRALGAVDDLDLTRAPARAIGAELAAPASTSTSVPSPTSTATPTTR